jgi:hypothetical protein
VWGTPPVAITLIGWFWPSGRETLEKREVEKWQKK